LANLHIANKTEMIVLCTQRAGWHMENTAIMNALIHSDPRSLFVMSIMLICLKVLLTLQKIVKLQIFHITKMVTLVRQTDRCIH
jgi:hypothetical protein